MRNLKSSKSVNSMSIPYGYNYNKTNGILIFMNFQLISGI